MDKTMTEEWLKNECARKRKNHWCAPSYERCNDCIIGKRIRAQENLSGKWSHEYWHEKSAE